VAIVDFLYYGEANVYEENIDALLAIAEELSLKGLSGNSRTEEIEKTPPIKPETSKRKSASKNSKTKAETSRLYKEESPYGDNTAPTEQTVAAAVLPNYVFSMVDTSDMKELDERINSMMRKSDNLCRGGSRKADICTVCGKEGQGRDIKDHIEANHIEGLSIPCNYCEKTCRSRASFRAHNKRFHTLTFSGHEMLKGNIIFV